MHVHNIASSCMHIALLCMRIALSCEYIESLSVFNSTNGNLITIDNSDEHLENYLSSDSLLWHFYKFLYYILLSYKWL